MLREVGRIFRQVDGSWFWGVSFQTDGPQELRSHADAPGFQGGVPGRV
jgi:hypothetical protein